MRFKFEPSGVLKSGIRLIGEIPNYQICHLEGKNGVGKTLAIHLLELITGQQPYRTSPRAWDSLRRGLGSTTVTIDDIDRKTLRIKLTPEQWPENPDTIGSWLGAATLDGKDLALESIPSLVQVIRIAGDETFEGSITRRLEIENEASRRFHDVFVQSLNSVVEDLDVILDATAAVEGIQRYETEEEGLGKEIDRLGHRVRELENESQLLDSAQSARARLKAMASDLPKLDLRLSQIDEESRKLEAEIRVAENRRMELLKRISNSAEVRKQIKRLRSLQERRTNRLKSLEKKIRTSGETQGVSPSTTSIEHAVEDTHRKLEEVKRCLASAGHRVSLRDLSAKVKVELGKSPDVDHEVIAIVDLDSSYYDLTVSGLRVGLERRALQLDEAADDDPQVRELTSRREELADKIKALKDLSTHVKQHQKARENLEEVEEQLASLVSQAAVATDSQDLYNEVTTQLEQLNEELFQRIAEAARLRVQIDQLRGDQSEEELREQISLVLDELQLSSDEDLPERRGTLSLDLSETRALLKDQREKLSSLRSQLTRKRVELQENLAHLAELDVISTNVRGSLAKPSTDERLAAAAALREATRQLKDDLYEARSSVDQFLTASQELVKEVDRRDLISSDLPYLAELSVVMGERLREEFDQDEIRAALFEGGTLEAIDLRRLEARWTDSTGKQMSRPFEAFSSGEQVFAYTRARIERASTSGAKHRVIALDEFGAFLARDRLERLASYLRDAVAGRFAEQVIIIIPLAANYEAQAEATSGPLGERFAFRARDIREQSFFAEDATRTELI